MPDFSENQTKIIVAIIGFIGFVVVAIIGGIFSRQATTDPILLAAQLTSEAESQLALSETLDETAELTMGAATESAPLETVTAQDDQSPTLTASLSPEVLGRIASTSNIWDAPDGKWVALISKDVPVKINKCVGIDNIIWVYILVGERKNTAGWLTLDRLIVNMELMPCENR